MLQRARYYTSALPRCSLCGGSIIINPCLLRRRISTIQTSSPTPQLAHSSRSFPWMTWALVRITPSLSHSSLRQSFPRRTFATILQIPSAAVEDLPEAPPKEGQESASNTLNITAAAEHVRLIVLTKLNKVLILPPAELAAIDPNTGSRKRP